MKPIQKQSLEELLDALKNASNEPISEPVIKEHFVEFLATFNIEPGDNKIKKPVLIELYKRWNKRTELQDQSISIQLGKYLEVKGPFFLVNKNLVNLTNAAHQLLGEKERSVPHYAATYRDINNFFKSHDIKTGYTWVPGYALYYLYDKWKYKNKTRPIALHKFVNVCKLFFRHMDTSNGLQFRVYRSISEHLSEEDLKQLRSGRKHGILKSKAKRKSAQQKKISRLG